MANFSTFHAVPLVLQAEYIATFLASEKVWISSADMPAEVGTGTTPQSTLSL